MKKTNFLVLLIFLILLTSPVVAIFCIKENVSDIERSRASFTKTPSLWDWTTTEVVSTVSSSYSYSPAIAVDTSGSVHVVWRDHTDYLGSGSDEDIFYRYWNAATKSWMPIEVVSTWSTDDSFSPDLVVDDVGAVYVVWQDYTDYLGSGPDTDIFYRHRDPTSGSWSSTELVSTESTSNSGSSRVDIDISGNVHVAWVDYTDYSGSGFDSDIFYKRRAATTDTWTSTTVISIESADDSWRPDLVVDDSGDVHIAWYDVSDYNGAGTDEDIFYKRFDQSTSAWASAEVVSLESTLDSIVPRINVDAHRNVHVAWLDETNYGGSGSDRDVFYKQRPVTTGTWSTPTVISTVSNETSYSIDLVIDKYENVHIAWGDPVNYGGSGADVDVLYRRWESGTETWVTTSVISTESSLGSSSPSMATDEAGHLHITWRDETDYLGAGTDYDIFYKKFGGPPVKPSLQAIVPNPTPDGAITLQWNETVGAMWYYIYRDNTTITSVSGKTPLTTTSTTNFTETLITPGTYHYAIVAGNLMANSTVSNSESVTYETSLLDNLPISKDLLIYLLLALGVIEAVIIVILLIKRR